MPGGLLQLASSGVQDKYLTHLPEITFFKSVYRRHTTFSIETKELRFDIEPAYGEETSVIIPNTGDLVYRIYVEIDIPNIDLKLSDIEVIESYTTNKNSILTNLNNKKNKEKMLYDNLKLYADYQIDIYNTIQIVLLSENFTLQNLITDVNFKNNNYTDRINDFLGSVDEEVTNNIDMVNYINELNNLNDVTSIKNEITKRYNILIYNLKKFYFRYKKIEAEYEKLLNEKIKVSWSKYLGHYFIENYEIEIGGNLIDSYSSDQLQIYQEHYLPESKKEIYYKMIGHTEDLYNFTSEKSEKKIIIPMIFWFNRSCGSALPLISLKYNNIKLNFKFNKKQNLIALENWDEEYKSLLKLYIDKSDFNKSYSSEFGGYLLNDIIIYPNEITLDIDLDLIIYTPKYINVYVLKYHYSSLTSDDISSIMSNYGLNDLKNLPSSYPSTINTNYIPSYLWKLFRRDLSSQTYKDKIFDYHNYVDKNFILNKIKNFDAKLLIEYIFLDDVEREKFSDSNLEYIIETFEENEFNISKTEIFNSEIDFRKTIKELIWFIQPKIELDGVTNYSIKKRYKFSGWDWDIDNSLVNTFSLILNQTNIFENINDIKRFELLNQFIYLNNKLPDGVSYYSFSLYPEEIQPSGNINLSQFKKKLFTVNISKAFLNKYFSSILNPNNLGLNLKILARSYNILTVSKGRGKLVFY